MKYGYCEITGKVEQGIPDKFCLRREKGGSVICHGGSFGSDYADTEYQALANHAKFLGELVEKSVFSNPSHFKSILERCSRFNKYLNSR